MASPVGASNEERKLDQLSINTIRMLSADAVQKANSGHPGLPMGAAAMAYVLWTRYLRHNPKNPSWPNRDRFVLSCGHGACCSTRCSPHGVRSRPRGDRVVSTVGLADAGPPRARHHAGHRDDDGSARAGFRERGGDGARRADARGALQPSGPRGDRPPTWAIASDGDLMEGISQEAASLAGHSVSRSSACSTTTTTSRSTARRTSRSRKTSRRDSSGYGWRVIRLGETTATPADYVAAAERAPGRSGVPDAGDLPHAHRVRRAQQAGHGRRARLAARSRGGARGEGEPRLARGRRSFCPARRARAHARAGRRGAKTRAAWKARRVEAPRGASRAGGAARPGAGGANSPCRLGRGWPSFEAGRAVATRKRSARGAERDRGRAVPNSSGGSADLTVSNGRSRGRGGGPAADATRDGTSTSACASTRWAGS